VVFNGNVEEVAEIVAVNDVAAYVYGRLAEGIAGDFNREVGDGLRP
jgi:hypothetical protein